MIMTIDHLQIHGLHRLAYATFGFFDGAQGFIFISGLVAGCYYSQLAERSGEAAMTMRALRRARDLYLTHLILLAMVLAGTALLVPSHPALAAAGGNHAGFRIPPPLMTLLLAATLLVQPQYFEVLPLYVILMLLVPLMVRSWRARQIGWVLGISGGLWLLSQPGAWTFPTLPAWVDFGYFNFFAWQFLFVCGLTLGCLQRSQAMGAGFDSTRTWAVVLALFCLFFVLRHSNIMLGAGPVDRTLDLGSWWYAKRTLGPLRIFDFALFAYLLAKAAKSYGPWLEKTVVHHYLRFLGQHSLQVFVWSILLWRGLPYSYKLLGMAGSVGAQIALSLIGVASLAIPAWLHANYRQQLREQAAPLRAELVAPAP